jgi:hypothetical protein
LEAELWDLHWNDSEEDDVYEEYKKASKRFEKIVEEDRKGDEKFKIERMTEAKKTRKSGHFLNTLKQWAQEWTTLPWRWKVSRSWKWMKDVKEEKKKRA